MIIIIMSSVVAFVWTISSFYFQFSPLIQDTVLKGTFNATLNNPITPHLESVHNAGTAKHAFLLGVWKTAELSPFIVISVLKHIFYVSLLNFIMISYGNIWLNMSKVRLFFSDFWTIYKKLYFEAVNIAFRLMKCFYNQKKNICLVSLYFLCEFYITFNISKNLR